MPDDFVINVRQILDYPAKHQAASTDFVVTQDGSVGHGPYNSMSVADLVSTALEQGGFIHLAPESGIAWNGAALMWAGGLFSFTEPVSAPNFLIGTAPVATQAFVLDELAKIEHDEVLSFNGRSGDVVLEDLDILRAGGAPIQNAHFGGFNTSPTNWDGRASSDQIATTAFVHAAFAWDLSQAPVLLSPDCTQVAHPLSTPDINAAYGVSSLYPAAPTPPLGDASNRIATTSFVDEMVTLATDNLTNMIKDLLDQSITQGNFAPLDSPQFTGVPTAPTANAGTHTGQIATTAFVMNQVAAATAGVASWNGRTGLVAMTSGDITTAGGALLASPVFTGAPHAPTPAPGSNDTSIATTAFVEAALTGGVTAGVSSFNTRTGAVTLTLADVTATNVLNNTALSGTPTAPTAVSTDNSTALATTAFVHAAVAAVSGGGVTSFNARTGVVTLQGSDVSAAGGALVASPTFTGTPSAPTASVGTNSTQLATTAFVLAQIGTLSFAPLASPAFTGAPTGPTATAGTSNNQLATTAFVQAAVTAGTAGVSSFNTRTGAVTLLASDVSGSGALNNTALTGTPTAPTPTAGTNNTTLANTQFVMTAIAAAGAGVSSFNTRTGAITLQASDVSAVGGALLASPTFTGAPKAPTPTAGDSSTNIATTAFVANALATAGGVASFNGRAGAVTLTLADVTGTNVLANTPLTGIPTAPTAAPGTNTTQLATTAFVTAAISGLAPLASPAFTGVPTGPTAPTATSNTQLATTAFVHAAAAGGVAGLVLLNTLTISNQAILIDNTSFSSAYDTYEIEVINVVPTGTIGGLQFQVFASGAWLTAGYNSLAAGSGNTPNTSFGASNSVNSFFLSGGASINPPAAVAGFGVTALVRLHGTNRGDAAKMMTGIGGAYTGVGANVTVVTIFGTVSVVAPILGIRIFFDLAGGNNMVSGLVRIYGRKTS